MPYFHFLLAADAVDCLQEDVTRCGGVTGWLREAALAQARGLEITARCAAHIAATVPNLPHIEWLHDHVRVEGLLFAGTLDPTGGAIRPGADTSPPAMGWHCEPRPPHRTRAHKRSKDQPTTVGPHPRFVTPFSWSRANFRLLRQGGLVTVHMPSGRVRRIAYSPDGVRCLRALFGGVIHVCAEFGETDG